MPPISLRELRAAFNPRPEPDYFDIAVRTARSRAAQLTTETHWNTHDAPIARGEQQAACGSYAPLARFSATPTCPACKQQQAIYDTFEF